MSDVVIRVHGPPPTAPGGVEAEVVQLRPRLPLQRHRGTPGGAENDVSFTAVAAAPRTEGLAAAVMSPRYWKSRMSVLICRSTG